MRFLVLAALLAGVVSAHSATLAHWRELGPAGALEERAAVDDARCPTASDGSAMLVRAKADGDFPLVCAATIHPNGQSFAPGHMVVLGDTGCRIKPPEMQDCSDPAKWPFPVVAVSAAKQKPELVIHVGDYLYREGACPADNSGCAGTPFGDNWPTWDADFFSPAAPLLGSAPFVFVRGNHEDCHRSGKGYLRLLAPGPYDASAPCAPHLAPYAVPAGHMSLVVLDDASASDTDATSDLASSYAADFASLATVAPKPLWLLTHRPYWGLITGPFGIPVGGNRTMIAASGDQSALAPVELMLAGHIHTFEAINYVGRVPPQIIAGNGGDNLDATPKDLRGAQFQGNARVSVKDGMSVGGFGFLVMDHRAEGGWLIHLHRADGTDEGQCVFAGGRVDCSVAGSKN